MFVHSWFLKAFFVPDVFII